MYQVVVVVIGTATRYPMWHNAALLSVQSVFSCSALRRVECDLRMERALEIYHSSLFFDEPCCGFVYGS